MKLTILDPMGSRKAGAQVVVAKPELGAEILRLKADARAEVLLPGECRDHFVLVWIPGVGGGLLRPGAPRGETLTLEAPIVLEGSSRDLVAAWYFLAGGRRIRADRFAVREEGWRCLEQWREDDLHLALELDYSQLEGLEFNTIPRFADGILISRSQGRIVDRTSFDGP